MPFIAGQATAALERDFVAEIDGLRLSLAADDTIGSAGPARTTDSVVVKTEDTGDIPWYHSGYAWKGPLPAEPDRDGARRDVYYFLGYQIVAIGVLYTLPTSITNWDKDAWKDEDIFGNWWENITHPEWDKDDWAINYIAHPYWGAAYYIRGRERGLDRTQSFLYSVLLSTLYETTLEAFFEPVSYQDLVVTPVLGSLAGEYLFSPLRQRVRAKPGDPTWSDKTILFLTDPLGVLGAWTDRMLGVETKLSVQPVGMTGKQIALLESETEAMQRRALAARIERPWGIQLEIPW